MDSICCYQKVISRGVQLNAPTQKRQVMVGGGGEKISPTMFSGKIEIPDLHYCFPCDTVNSVQMVKMGIWYLFPISPSTVHDCETCNRAICANNSDCAQLLFS
jgi:hypothetical protein